MSEGAATVLVTNENFAKQYSPDHYVEITGAGLSSCTIRAGDRYAFPGWTDQQHRQENKSHVNRID